MIRRYLTALGIAAVAVTLDLVTKRYAAIRFAAEPVELIPGLLGFTYLENPGSAFSLFQDSGEVIGALVIVVIVVVAWSLRRERPMAEVVGFGLIIGGALGNLADRVFRGPGLLDGKVIDWIDLWWIPTFNLADMSVFFAVSLLLIHAWIPRSAS